MSDQPNPIAERSRRMLADALVELMADRPYTEITVTDIAARAGLSRRTFYRNVTTRDALLGTHLRSLMLEYVDRIRPVVHRPIDEVVAAHLEFWTDHLVLLRLLAANGMGHLVLDKYNEYIVEAVELTGSTRYAGSPRPEYALAYNVGGHFNVLFEWLRRGAVDSPRQVADAFRIRTPPPDPGPAATPASAPTPG